MFHGGVTRSLARRRRGSLAAVLAILVCGLALALASTALGATAIQTENAQAGTANWRLQDAPYPTSAQSYAGLVTSIDGYTVEQSVAPGGTVQLHVAVATPDLRYRIRVYRLGWYGGTGARRKACLPSPDCFEDRAGVVQPATPPVMDPVTGEVRADWPVTDTIAVGSDWVSGYYVAMLELTTGPAAGTARWVPFVVTAPGSRSAAMVQVPSTTWLAYNGWGGKSTYDNKSANGIHANKVSFARPYWAAEYHLFDYEYPLVRYLERQGFDLSYATDVDVHRAPSQLRNHKLIVVAGHDEYWSKEMRDGFDAARDAGVNLANMGANNGYWQVRFENDEQTMVSYKTTADPFPDANRKTLRFRDLPSARPECRLWGVQYELSDAFDGVKRDYTVVDGTNPWFTGTGLTSGSVVPGVVGYEWDLLTPGCQTPPLTQLFHWSDQNGLGKPDADAVMYTAPSGARVFSSGSIQFSWGLDGQRNGWTSSDDPRLRAFMTNVISDLTGGPAPPPPANVAPSAAFAVAPAAPQAAQTVTFTDTSTDSDGTIAARAWDLDDDGSFDDGAGATAARAFPAAGTYRVRLRVTDDDGATAIATRQVVLSAATTPTTPTTPTPPAPPAPGPTLEPPPLPAGVTPPAPVPPGSLAAQTGPQAACVRYSALVSAGAKSIRTKRAKVRAAKTRAAHNAWARRLKADLNRQKVLTAQRARACAQR